MKETYLYIKQHSVTGLKYFGKTTRNPLSYLGSGKAWIRHIRKYGTIYVKTLEVFGPFTDETDISNFAIKFSKDNNIIKSSEWANLQIENGLDGFPSSGKIKPPHKEKKIAMAKSEKNKLYYDKKRVDKKPAKTAAERMKALRERKRLLKSLGE